MPESTLVSVDLPAALSPTSPRHSPGPEVEVDAAQRLDRAEGLDDPAQAGARGPGGLLLPDPDLRHYLNIARKASTFSLVTMVIGTLITGSTVPPAEIAASASTAASPIPAGSCWTTALT